MSWILHMCPSVSFWIRVFFLPPPDPNAFSDQPASGRKKKPLTDLEIALKREETARKRKNLTEKKLEDEKVKPLYL